jgi:hypothetical protein
MGADLGEFHLAPRLAAQPRGGATSCPLASENRLIRRLLRTGLQPGGPALSGLSGLQAKDHFCQASMRPRARPGTSRIPGLPRYAFTSSAPPRTFTESPRNCGSSR